MPRRSRRLLVCALLLAASAQLPACDGGDDGSSSGAGAGGTSSGPGGGGGQGGTGGGSDAVCGNGVTEQGETCDGDCPDVCPDDGDACTAAVLVGSAATCDAGCAQAPVTACESGDGCCPAGCAAPADLDCVACDVTVPDDHPTIAEAILAAPAPGVVCIRPGQYAENLTLRPHVSLQGFGPGTEILGHVSVAELGDPDPTPTTLRDLSIRAGYLAVITSCPADDAGCGNSISLGGQTLALTAERVLVDSDPAAGTTWCGKFDIYDGPFQITFRDSVCRGGDRGIRVVSGIQNTPVDYQLIVEGSRFEPATGGDYIYDSVEFLISQGSTCGQQMVPAGSRVQAVIRNNEFFRTLYEGIYTYQCLVFDPADAMQSSIAITNNTFVVQEGATADQTYAVWNNSLTGLQPTLIVANNLYWGTNPNAVRGEPADVYAGNLLPGADPFVDLAAGDLHLAAGSAAIDAADPAHAPPTDKDGDPRPADGDQNGSSLPDVGADEYTP